MLFGARTTLCQFVELLCLLVTTTFLPASHSLDTCIFNQSKQKSRLLDDKPHQERIVLFGSNSSFRNNASLSSLTRESKQFEKGIGTKKFLNFWGLWQDTICLMRYSCQALFPPSTRATLKSFGDVFAQTCCQCRCKWDGTLGTASADFQVIRQPRKHWILKGQRICRLKRKECWFKTQIVWGEFQHNVLKSFSKRTLHFIRWSQTNWWNLLSRKQRQAFWERKCQQKKL